MLRKLQVLIEQISSDLQGSASQDINQPVLEQVTAALMIQLARIDHRIENTELEVIREYIRKTFNVDGQELAGLLDDATAQADESTSLYEFTSLIHERLSSGQKYEIVLNLWRIAYADGHLDKYEEHFIRRAAELIYVPHAEFMRAKHEASAQ